MIKHFKKLLLWYFVYYQLLFTLFLNFLPPDIFNYAYVIGTILFSLIIIYYSKPLFLTSIFPIKKSTKSIIITLVLTLLLSFFITCFSNDQNLNQLQLEEQLRNSRIILISLVIFGPIMEEIIFHYTLFNVFRKLFSSITSMVMVAFLFSIAHCLGDLINGTILIPSFLQSFCFSFILSIEKEKYDCVYHSIIIHSLYNLIAIILI